MNTVELTIDGQPVQVAVGTTILEAARSVDIYIPRLCHHPDLPPANGSEAAGMVFQGSRELENAMPEKSGVGCGLCVVEVAGSEDLVGACATPVAEGMEIVSNNGRIKAVRQEKLLPIMARHRHACLTCAQQEGCPRTQCSLNVPENERCCSLFGHCELQNVVNYVGLLDSTPRWIPTDLTVIDGHPLFVRDFNLCIGCTRCVRACRDLRGIEALGFVYDEYGQVQIGTVAETLESSGCKFCTACVAVCPTGALVDKAVGPATRKEDIVPCKAACPAHIDVPGYLRLIAQGKADEANAVIREKVPFPGVLGRVCIHPCEPACRRGEVNEPIAICALKRYAAEGQKGLWKAGSKVAKATGQKVAVIGAGPAGLTASFYLRKQGHAVTLFESSSQAGGMLRYGIPEFRLPRTVLDNEIKEILDLDVDFRANQSLGRDFSLDRLTTDGFDAVFLSVGAQQSGRIPLEDCSTPAVLWGLEFLRQVADGADVKLKDSVVVIGGGNVAVDVALTALRCEATDVKMVCLEGLDEMPASPWEIEGAVAEGVQILPSRGPEKIVRQDGQVTGLDLAECTCVFDDQGNFCPEFSEKKECILVDQVIMAVGQATDLSFLRDNRPIKADRGLIVVNADTLETGMSSVYAGGDIAMAPGAVIHAIAAGRRAAESIDSALEGGGDIDETLFTRGNPDPYLGRDEGFAFQMRQAMPELDVATRIKGFQEIASGYSDEAAVKEANRCLQCDLRLQIGCNPAPPQAWQPFDEEHVNAVPESQGVYQLLDADHNVLAIKGTANLRQDLLLALDEYDAAALFEIEEDKMYSQRESELIQKYLQEHGEMPGGGADDLDDLF
ncbi:Formate dehydrogenase-O, major subunit (EC [Olavius sp. associated proteobacterium Delta 1]|nr:Formate dehydrogenase-O, major subunit (EC [Olavius sp. associated proteobacterium Delta 1]